MALIEGYSGEWEMVIGLEVHAQVISKAKLFSGAATEFGGAPNSQVSLVDAAMPGMLPVLNRVCIEQAVRKHRGLEPLDAMDFLALAREKMKAVEMDQKFMNRSVNEGFSGGEKKRNEILQMAILDPKLAILDETDSGLDIDALRIVADGVNRLRGPDRAMLVITHYQRLLDYIVPDRVHVLAEGRIATSGGKELALELEKKGYTWLEEAPAP